MALVLIQPLTEMNTGMYLRNKERPERKAEILTIVCVPIVWNSGIQHFLFVHTQM
jgi:hypothetical protein